MAVRESLLISCQINERLKSRVCLVKTLWKCPFTPCIGLIYSQRNAHATIPLARYLPVPTVKLSLLLAAAIASLSTAALSSTYDNEAGVYTLNALPDPEREAARMDRMQLSDQQPAGRYVRRGETLTITTEGLPEDFVLSATIGFQKMWGVQQGQQAQALNDGDTRFRANQDGPIFFKFNPPSGQDDAQDEVALTVRGGQPLPLYVDGSMDAQAWAEELDAHSDAPFVQLLGDQAMITLPAAVHDNHPIPDPEETFAVINTVVDRQNQVAGFDGRSERDQPTRLRLHYLVDFRVSAKDRESFYMYATDQFIGMLDNNTSDLTDPARLREQWGIWHETGHTHQQNSWTFEALGEVNVNLYSLYVQEGFGEQSLLRKSEDGEASYLEQARDYLNQGAKDFLAEVSEEDDSELFIKLVMFHQLKTAYGWDLFMDLHKHFRLNPLSDEAADQDKADAFVQALCVLTNSDLRPFFERWGLEVSDAARAEIDLENYALADEDALLIFE